jgi:hypothetical protein
MIIYLFNMKTVRALTTSIKQGIPVLAVAAVVSDLESVCVGNCYYRELLFG